MIGEILKWIRDTEIYKDDKLWQLFCSVFPSIEVIVGWIFAFFQKKRKICPDCNVMWTSLRNL